MQFSNLISRFWKPDRLTYIGLNVGISVLGFFRSFVFLKSMDYYELGIVSIFQTIIMLLSLTQVGTLNGAYRAFSGHKKFHRKAVNNFIFSFFLLLCGLCVVPTVLILSFSYTEETLIFLCGAIAGILALVVNYLNNTLLSDSRLNEVNVINLVSNGIGFSFLLLMYVHPLWGLATFIVQPAVFIIASFIADRSLIPRRIFFSSSVFRFLLALGFIPFLTSLFTYLNQQVERWSIVLVLGVETFGHFYLAVAFASVYALFPNSVNNLYFPRMVRAYSQRDLDLFGKLLKNYNIILGGYSIAAIAATLLLAPLVVEWLFPQHLGGLQYVYYTLPGLVALSAANPYVVYFNSSLRLSPLVISYGASSVVILIVIAALWFANSISLATVAIADSVGNLTVCAAVVIFYVRYRAMEQHVGNDKIA